MRQAYRIYIHTFNEEFLCSEFPDVEGFNTGFAESSQEIKQSKSAD
jgi:hypothetical protein